MLLGPPGAESIEGGWEGTSGRALLVAFPSGARTPGEGHGRQSQPVGARHGSLPSVGPHSVHTQTRTAG